MDTADYEQVVKYANAAIEAMKKRHISPTPLSFNVWYNYCSFNNLDLVDEIDKATNQGVTFDEGMHNYLYDKYVSADNHFNANLHQDTKQLLSQVLGAISQFSGDTASYNEQMEGHIQNLESSSGKSDDVNSLLERILHTTRTLKSSGDVLSEKLIESRREVENLRQNLAEATQQAQRDFLTGLFNRKALDRFLDEITALAAEQKTPLSLLMLDIDHFKKYNDTFGHLIGDEVLKTIAKILTDSLKGKDIVARYGGEEFCVLLPCTSVENAYIVADNIRQSVASKKLVRKDTGQPVGSLTISVGVAGFRPGIDTVPILLKRADDALYASKKQGRNRVTISESAAAA